MKQTNVFVAVVFSVISLCFCGCGGKSGEELIVGKWERTTVSFLYYGSINESSNYGATYSIDNAQGMSIAKFSFKEDKFGLLVNSYIDSWGMSKSDSIYFTYRISDDSLYITGRINADRPEETYGYKIEELTRKKLVVSITGCPMHGFLPREHDYWADETYVLERR